MRAKLDPTKQYLVVFCKACAKGFRVVDHPLFEGQAVEIREARRLKCRGCGHEAVYEPREMRVARIEPKPT